MILKIIPDKEKAISLIDLSKVSFERLKNTDIIKYSANSLTDYYDIIHKLMEAISFIEGIKIKGEGAHQELIDYICKKYNISEANRIFLQELRDYRNRISYEGLNINPNYIKENRKRIEEIIKSLQNKINL